jgi:hypothetical protein
MRGGHTLSSRAASFIRFRDLAPRALFTNSSTRPRKYNSATFRSLIHSTKTYQGSRQRRPKANKVKILADHQWANLRPYGLIRMDARWQRDKRRENLEHASRLSPVLCPTLNIRSLAQLCRISDRGGRWSPFSPGWRLLCR